MARSDQLDAQLRKVGYCLLGRARGQETARWRVIDQHNNEIGCDDLAEVNTLLNALTELDEHDGYGSVVFDGSQWIYTDD